MITLKSFGFKYGRPEANFVFDVSYLPNPWRDKEIRDCKDKKKRRILIKEFTQKDTNFYTIARGICHAIVAYNAAFPNENLVFGVCCSAGEYRSPVIVGIISDMLAELHIKHKVEQSKNSKL